jgi:hypothetical protein
MVRAGFLEAHDKAWKLGVVVQCSHSTPGGTPGLTVKEFAMSIRNRFQSVGMVPKVAGGAALACGLALGGVGVANAATVDSAGTAATQQHEGHNVTGAKLTSGEEGKYTTIPQGEKRAASDTHNVTGAKLASGEEGKYTTIPQGEKRAAHVTPTGE